MCKNILLLGGGGNCKVVIDTIMSMNIYDKIGIVDLKKDDCLGMPFVGYDDDLQTLYQDGWNYAFVTLGSIGNPATRIKLYDKIREIGFKIPNIVDKTAYIGIGSIINQGTYIGKNVVINPNVIIGECSIINTGVIIEHDCQIGSFVHLSPGSILCGNVTVDDNSHIGAGSVVRQQIKIGKNAIIGIGSVVVKDIPSNIIAYGNPCEVK